MEDMIRYSSTQRASFALYLAYSVLFICVCSVLLRSSEVSAKEQAHGLRVYLPRECRSGDVFYNRTVVFQVLPNGKTEVNMTPISHKSLGTTMASIFATREEKLLRLIVDRRASYSDVISAIDQVKISVPRLTILLVDSSTPDPLQRACISPEDVLPEDR